MSKSVFFTAVLAGLIGYLAGQWPSADATGETTRTLEPVIADDAVTRHYVCPMHAEIVSDSAGSCPICGMDLVEQAQRAADTTENGLPVVTIEPSVVHNLGVRTATVSYGDLQRSIETIGKITRVDPMARRTITPPIRGELVDIADKHDGDFITGGEFLFSVKSGALFEREKALQDAYRSGDRATANAMIPELSDMGLTPEQISRLQAGEKPEMPVEVHAFENGFIYSRRGHIGEKVHTGFTVFNVGGNYRVIEVTAEIFERQWGWVAEGQKARMTVRGLPGTIFEGEVVRVDPPVGYTTRSLEVVLKFKTNNPELSQSMFAHVSIAGQARKHVLIIPTDSVIRTGSGDRVVLIRGKNQFQPVAVVAGEESGGMIEIRSGLEAGDKVVASGQFLIDSESNLLAGFRRLATPGTGHPGHDSAHRHAGTQLNPPVLAAPHTPPASHTGPVTTAPPVENIQPVSYLPASRF